MWFRLIGNSLVIGIRDCIFFLTGVPTQTRWFCVHGLTEAGAKNDLNIQGEIICACISTFPFSDFRLLGSFALSLRVPRRSFLISPDFVFGFYSCPTHYLVLDLFAGWSKSFLKRILHGTTRKGKGRERRCQQYEGRRLRRDGEVRYTELGIVMVLASLVRHVRSFLGDPMVRSFYLTHERPQDRVSGPLQPALTYSLIRDG